MAPNCHKFKEPRNPGSLIPNIVRNHGTGICCSASVWAGGPAKRCATACCHKKDNASWPSMMSLTTPLGCLHLLVRWVMEFLDCRCKSCLPRDIISNDWGVSLLHFVKKLSFFKSGKFTRQDFDGIDFPSSSASMLEVVAQVECDERISRCAKQHQTRMWAACATKYHWQILVKDVNTGYCPPDQVITSNRHFDKCKVLENMPNMLNVKWSSDGGEERCTRFDNKCLETLKKGITSGKLDIKKPRDWESKEENKNVEVVRFIRLGQ